MSTELETAIITGITGMQTDGLSIIASVVPLAIGLVAAMFAVRFALKSWRVVSGRI